MKKTWGEIKSEIINLGAERSETFAANPSCFIEAANRAISIVACYVRPVVEKITLDLSEMGEDRTFDIRAMAAEQKGRDCFIGYIKEMPVMFAGSCRSPEYRVTPDNLLIIGAGQVGEIEVYYRLLPAVITAATPDETELELDYDAAGLIALLASFYVWADEDERKAVMFRNDYEDLKRQLTTTLEPAQGIARVYEAVSGNV